jgi:hypothetical protein
MSSAALLVNSTRFDSVKLDSVSVRIINEPFMNTIICSNIKRDIFV